MADKGTLLIQGPILHKEDSGLQGNHSNGGLG
jgi:hypothetical protein